MITIFQKDSIIFKRAGILQIQQEALINAAVKAKAAPAASIKHCPVKGTEANTMPLLEYC